MCCNLSASSQRTKGNGSRTRGNGMKLLQGKFSSDIQKMFFTEGLVGHWNRVFREVVTAPSLSESKERLDDDLSHLVYFR